MIAEKANKLTASALGYVCAPIMGLSDLTGLHAQHPQRYPHLLASTARGTPRSRYDILFAFPGDTLALESDRSLYRNGKAIGAGDFLKAFDRDYRQTNVESVHGQTASADSPPFTGGWFIFLGYELTAEIEPSVGGNGYDPSLPIASATRFPAAVINDHEAQRTLLVCETDTARDLMPLLQEDLRHVPALCPTAITTRSIDEEDPAMFLDRVERIQQYIRAGDTFQVNLSRRWRIALENFCSPIDIFLHLSTANPAPFSGLMTFGPERAIISSSPERLVEVRGREIHTRPIAGTYPRNQDPEKDRSWSQELLQNPKERAEHVMLIDLERNDLGRVCRLGTVKVNEFMALESYRHVHHIVSEVSGSLRDEVSPADIIRAVFPGGTITGCPKVRCMQIIAELEGAPRGAYTGSMGYINRDGSMELNILIRTLVQNGRHIQLRAGAGIVADSIPERELQETRAKAKGILAALGIL